MTYVLLYPRFTFFYAFGKFALSWDLVYELLNTPIHISAQVRLSVCVDQVYRASPIMFMGYKTLAGLAILDM